MSTAKQIARFIRWSDWGTGKLPVLWGICLYIAIAYDLPFGSFAMTFVVFIPFVIAQCALGYVLNEWGDRELDRRQFKHNAFNGKSYLESTLALTLVVVTALVSGIPLILRSGFVLLWLAWAATASAYSLEPARLKARGLVGLAVAFVAQWFLPVLIAFAAFEVAGGWDMWFLALALTIHGAAAEIGHQRADRARNMHTLTHTFAVEKDKTAIDNIYTIALILDKLSIGLVIVVVAIALVSIGTPWATALAIITGILYVLLLLISLEVFLRASKQSIIEDPYKSSHIDRRSLTHILHNTLLIFGLPLILGVAATLHSPLYGIFLGLFLVGSALSGGTNWNRILSPVKVRSNK